MAKIFKWLAMLPSVCIREVSARRMMMRKFGFLSLCALMLLSLGCNGPAGGDSDTADGPNDSTTEFHPGSDSTIDTFSDSDSHSDIFIDTGSFPDSEYPNDTDTNPLVDSNTETVDSTISIGSDSDSDSSATTDTSWDTEWNTDEETDSVADTSDVIDTGSDTSADTGIDTVADTGLDTGTDTGVDTETDSDSTVNTGGICQFYRADGGLAAWISDGYVFLASGEVVGTITSYEIYNADGSLAGNIGGSNSRSYGKRSNIGYRTSASVYRVSGSLAGTISGSQIIRDDGSTAGWIRGSGCPDTNTVVSVLARLRVFPL